MDILRLPACNFLSQYYFYNIFLQKSCRFSLQTLAKFEATKTGSGVGFLRLTAVWLMTLSYPEAAILLVSTKNWDLCPTPIFEHAQNICCVIFSQSDWSDLTMNPLILDFGGGQRSWFLVLTKRIAASGYENEVQYDQVSLAYLWCGLGVRCKGK